MSDYPKGPLPLIPAVFFIFFIFGGYCSKVFVVWKGCCGDRVAVEQQIFYNSPAKCEKHAVGFKNQLPGLQTLNFPPILFTLYRTTFVMFEFQCWYQNEPPPFAWFEQQRIKSLPFHTTVGFLSDNGNKPHPALFGWKGEYSAIPTLFSTNISWRTKA